MLDGLVHLEWRYTDQRIMPFDHRICAGKVGAKGSPKGDKFALEKIRGIDPSIADPEAVAVGKPCNQCAVVRHGCLPLQVLAVVEFNVLVGAIVKHHRKLDDVAKCDDIEEPINLRDVDDVEGDWKIWNSDE